LDEVIKLDPKYTNAYYNLSLIYYNLGNKETAMKEYEIVKELNANLAENLLPLISK
jgi:Tfp pilus assembly protein PilF